RTTGPDTFVAVMLASRITFDSLFALNGIHTIIHPTTARMMAVTAAITPCLTCGLHDLHQSRNDSQRDFRGVMRCSLMVHRKAIEVDTPAVPGRSSTTTPRNR